jgi:hypothetical protein
VVKCSEVLQCSVGLRNSVSNSIRRHTDNMKLLLVCTFAVITCFHILYVLFFINVYMVVLLFNIVIYVFLLLCLCILIACLCIFIVPAGTFRRP